jgi:hypothetical protein
MKTSIATRYGPVLAVLLTAAPAARADLVHWSYNWSRSPSEVLSDSGESKITLTDETTQQVIGDSDIVATNLRTFSTAPDGSPDHFTNKSFVLKLTLIDHASSISGALTLTGVFNGTLSEHNANITMTPTGMTTQSIILGNAKYTAKFDYFSPPGPPDATNSGSIGAHVSVTVQLLTGGLPEPNSLILASLGALLLGLARHRRRWQRFPLKPA